MSSESSVIASCSIAGIIFSLCLFKCFFANDMAISFQQSIYEVNQAYPKKLPVILGEMEASERLRILETVLKIRLWSKGLSAHVKLEYQKKEENKQMSKMENGHLSLDENVSKETHYAGIVNDEEKLETQKEKEEGQPKEIDKVWSEFEYKRNDINHTAVKDEVTEPCAICMEDYKENEEVVVGHNCMHMYHKKCLIEWMQANHDLCPSCRRYSFPVSKFVMVAKSQLGDMRFKELVKKDDPDLITMYTSGTELEGLMLD